MSITETGIKRTEDGISCEKCGNDLSQAGAAKLIAHMDGVKYWKNVFECTKCGAVITQEFARNTITEG